MKNFGIRDQYSSLGVDKYYENHAASYENPHGEQVVRAVERALEYLPSISTALDLACGDGIVTRTLTSGGICCLGCDPYFGDIYQGNTGSVCFPYSFMHIATKGLDTEFDVVFCSYALHLCEESLLPSLEYRLSQIAGFLVVITPNKKPKIGHFWDLVHEEMIERTRLRIYLKK